MKKAKEITDKYNLGEDAELDILRYLEYHKKQGENELETRPQETIRELLFEKAHNAYMNYIDEDRKGNELKSRELYGKHCAYHEVLKMIKKEGL